MQSEVAPQSYTVEIERDTIRRNRHDLVRLLSSANQETGELTDMNDSNDT